MRAVVAALVAAGTIIVACTPTTGLASGDGSGDGGNADGAAATTVDGSTTSTTDGGGGGSDSTAGGPNLLTNADFELGCAAWSPGFGSMSEATTAHGGSGSCKFCMDTNWEAFLEQNVKIPVEAGKTYYAEAWFKPAKTIAELETAGYVENNLRASSPGAGNDFTNGPTLTGDWQRVTSLFKPTLPANEIYVQFRLQQTGNPADVGDVICFFVDDVVLRRLD